MIIVGVDVGINNLALVLLECIHVYRRGLQMRLLDVDLVDLCQLKHSVVQLNECNLHHSNMLIDRISHMIQEYRDKYFDKASIIAIERQPPGGIVAVEQLIMAAFRDKSVLVAPQSVHKMLGWGKIKLNYDQRKEQSLSKMKQWLRERKCMDLEIKLQQWDRQHDISDAFWIAQYQCLTMMNNMEVVSPFFAPSWTNSNSIVYSR